MATATPNPLADYLTIPQAAARWGVHRSRVYVWIREGRVPTVQTPFGQVIPRSTRKPRPRKPA